MPDIAGGWPEEGAQYTPGAPMEPVQQYPQAPQQHAQYQQAYPQQGYQEPQQAQQQYQQPQQQYGAAQSEYPQVPQQYQQPQQQYGGQQPGYPNQYQEQQQYQEQTAPQQSVYAEEEQSSVPSEFDHLFRDSSPQERRSISGRQPMVSGPGAAASPGFPQGPGQQPQEAQGGPAAATALFTGPPAPGAVYEDRAPAGYAPDYGGPFSAAPGGQGGGPGGRRTPLIIGGVVVLIAAVGLYLGLSGGGGSGKSPTAAKSSTAATTTASNETAQQQADAVYQLVQQAKTLRSDINGGVDKLLACDVSGAESEITSTAQARASAAAAVAKLPVDKISGASALVADLQTAWQDSANSDQDYGKAAADFASGGCSKSAVKNDSNYQAAQSASGSTASAKETAANLWNQVMASYESKISENDL